MVGDQQSSSSKEEDGGQADSSSSSASGSEDWDSDKEVADRKAPRHAFPLRLGVLNVRGWARKRVEVKATMRRQRLDVLGVTETHSRRQGWQFAPSCTALETGAVDVEGKAVLVPEEAVLTLCPEGATDTEFVVVVQSGEVDRLHLVLVYARPGAAGLAVYHRWTDIVTSSALPVVVMGDFNKDAVREPQLSRVKEWGYQVHPPRWAWTWRGTGAHAGQNSMIDFVLVPHRLPVRECRLVGHMPVRTDHRLVVVEVSLRGARPARLGVLPTLAR